MNTQPHQRSPHSPTEQVVGVLPRIGVVVAGLLMLATSTGCLALGLPSQRIHDPADQGGILGDWKHSASPMPPEVAVELVAGGGVVTAPYESCGSCTAPGLLDLPPGTSAFDMQHMAPASGKQEKPPEVPWPRFHPVPTRPVFGSTAY